MKASRQIVALLLAAVMTSVGAFVDICVVENIERRLNEVSVFIKNSARTILALQAHNR